MKKAKKITNKELMKKLEELQKLAEQNNKQIMPYIIQPVMPIPNYGHSHCTCGLCHPRLTPVFPHHIGPAIPNWTITSMNTGNTLGLMTSSIKAVS